jgi:hypothetical protein
MAKIEVTCDVCGKTFLRERGEVARSKRLGRRSFCSRQCTGIANVENLPEKEIRLRNLRRGGREPDEFSPFREYLKLARRRMREQGQTTSLTLRDLKHQWDLQQGICPLTGWELEIPRTTRWDEYPITPQRASLDRIDSAQGYIRSNIRFIAVMANYCKHIFTDQDVIDFCYAVVAYQDRLASGD